MSLVLVDVIQNARREINLLTGLDVSSTVGAEKNGDEWLVKMEVVEKHSIPEGMDILATYEMRLDMNGNIIDFKRTRMRKRVDTEENEY